jgi:hypothetical protein
MIIIDLLGEELGLRQSDLAQSRIVRLQDSLAHVGGLEDRAIFVEEPLVVSKMVGIDYFAMSVFKSLEATINDSTHLQSSCRPMEDLEGQVLREQSAHRL